MVQRMSAEVKTTFKSRLSDILSLVSNIRWIGVAFRLIPTIDYHNVMTETKWYSATGLAGNESHRFSANHGEKIIIEYGRIYLDTDGTAGNRRFLMRIRNKDTSITAYAKQNDTNIVANETKTMFLNRYDYRTTETEHPSADQMGIFIVPNELLDEDEYQFEISGGKAGDSWNIHLRYHSIPQPRSYEQ